MIFLRRRIRELRLKHFVRAADLGKFLNDLLDFMRRCQDELVGPEKYADYVRRLERGELPLPRVSKKKDADALTLGIRHENRAWRISVDQRNRTKRNSDVSPTRRRAGAVGLEDLAA